MFFGQHLKSALGCGVRGYGLTAKLAHHGADVNDFSVALLNHAGDDCLGHDEWRVQIHVNDLSELGSRHIAHGNPTSASSLNNPA